MVPGWLHVLSIVFLALGLVLALAVAADEVRRPQAMWIMNVVWPVTAFTAPCSGCGSTSASGGQRRGRIRRMPRTAATIGRRSRSRRASPSRPSIAAAAAPSATSSRNGWPSAVPAIAVWFGWHSLFGDKMFAVWIARLPLRLRVRHRVPVLHHQADAQPVARAGARRGGEGGHAVADRLAGRHVRLDGDRAFVIFGALSRRSGSRSTRRVLVHDADRDALRLSRPAIPSTGG